MSLKVGEIIVTPLAAESMGVRSLCVRMCTPQIRILFDPSAALARRYRLEPHPLEYRRLRESLDRIFAEAEAADVLSISHYHFDHVRPGFTDYRYTLGSRDELRQMFQDKRVLAKDFRDHINASQRKRGFYFEKGVRGIVQELTFVDNLTIEFGDTKLIYSRPLPHGPEGTRLGYVLATTVEHDGIRVTFAPDVQGPISPATTDYLIGLRPDLLIIGGPPVYLDRIVGHIDDAASNLQRLATEIPYIIVDHHLLRTPKWREWLAPIIDSSSKHDHVVTSMAGAAGHDESCLEARRRDLYRTMPPSQEFMNWVGSTDDYKRQNPPPI